LTGWLIFMRKVLASIPRLPHSSTGMRFGISRSHAGSTPGLPRRPSKPFAGHSTLSVTMDRYGHLFKSDSHRHAMDAIAQQFVAAGPERSQTPGVTTKEPKQPEP
jgi:hypothetical protein